MQLPNATEAQVSVSLANSNQLQSVGVTGAAAVAPPTPPPSSSDDGSMVGIIVGCVIGAIVLIILVVCGYRLLQRRQNHFDSKADQDRMDQYVASFAFDWLSEQDNTTTEGAVQLAAINTKEEDGSQLI